MKLYHLVPATEWRAALAAGQYRPASLQTEGFVHLSTSVQWLGAANRFYRGHRDLWLLEVDPDRLRAEIRYEVADGDRFPHLYGPMELEAATVVCALTPSSDGTFDAPRVAGGEIDYEALRGVTAHAGPDPRCRSGAS
jgi:uncharacterized protein (DUF952 family)